MKISASADKQFFDALIHSKDFRNIKPAFAAHFAPEARWCVVSCGRLREVLFWDEGREAFSRKSAFSVRLLSKLKRSKDGSEPVWIRRPGNCGGFFVPLVSGERLFGYLGVQGNSHGADSAPEQFLPLLIRQTDLAVSICLKQEEIIRLSASIRPRAIALSTVHTVHRIINSTLNLDELVSRLAHLTAQVLRANRCAIYFVENVPRSPRGGRGLFAPQDRPKTILCRARVGYPKKESSGAPIRIKMGKGMEGKVAKTAKIVLRKDRIIVPLIDEDVIGVMHISNRKEKKEFTIFDQEILTTLAEEAVIAIKNAQLYEEQKKVTLGTIQSLAVILGTRVDNVIAPETFLLLALKMAEELKLGEDETQALHYATLLKDTAKIGIPDQILKKPTKLTGEEYRALREHPAKGAQIVQSFENLRSVVPIVLYSREKFDGCGYPKGLKGEKIPIGARILSLINAFEAIIIGRPYRDRSSIKEALEEILKNSGTQFDPKVVEAFLRVVKRSDFSAHLQKVLRKRR